MTNDREETLLMIQCINSYLEGVKLLIEHGADVNITDGQGNSALILACRHYKDARKDECSEIVELLAAKGVNMNAVSVFSSPIRGYERGTVLFEACIKGRLEIVPLLMKLGAAIDATSQNPLIESCTLHNLDVVRFLISHGANVNIIDYYGHTCLSVACRNGFDDIVELLLDHGADINLVRDIYRYTPFILAIMHGRVSTVKLLLDRGASVHRKGNAVPLLVASQHGQVGVARLLLERGADVQEARYGTTPLIAAAAYPKDRGMIGLLLEYGADINAENEVGYCALGAADECNRLDTAKLLLERGADLYKEDGVTSVATLRRGVRAKNPALIEKYGEIN